MMIAIEDKSYIDTLKNRLHSLADRPVNIMEVCGTHTVAIARSGLKQVIPSSIKLLSGPGCPVCVTSTGDIDRILALGEQKNVILATFGDMLHVPGTKGSLENLSAERRNVRVVYSPMDALELAVEMKDREIVFAGVGFETTAPLFAAVVLAAEGRSIPNFSVAPLFKLVPPALRAILAIKKRRIDGFLLPGNVSAVIGERPYRFIADEHGIPGVISGFDPEDILESLVLLMQMLHDGHPAIMNEYKRSVTPDGNSAALQIMDEVLWPVNAEWRAIGFMPDSGLGFRPEFQNYDAFFKFSIPQMRSVENKACRCGDILLGLCGPLDCPLFRKACSPSNPIGPCMVSSEGSCAAIYHYGEDAL